MREIQEYNNAKVENIQQSASGIDWDFIFQGKTVNQKVNILNEYLLNIFRNCIPNTKTKFNYKDLSWVDRSCKEQIKRTLQFILNDIIRMVKKILTC